MRAFYITCLAAVALASLEARAQTENLTKKSEAEKLESCLGDYRQIVRCALPIVVKVPTGQNGAEISPRHPTRLTQLGDSMACVMLSAKDGFSFIAFFFDGDKYSDARRAVAIDGCRNEVYTPLVSVPIGKTRKQKRHSEKN